MPEVLADQIKTLFCKAHINSENQNTHTNSEISLKSERKPDEAFLSEKVAFEI